MSNKIANVPYDQIPHIVKNHPDTTPEHWAIMIVLFKILKDVPYPIIYSNEQLAADCRMSLRSIERRLPELNKMMLLNITGRGFQRRIRLGLLFSTTANMAVVNPTTAKNDATTAKSDPHNRQYGGDYNPSYNPSSKEGISFSLSLNPKNQTPTVTDHQEYAAGVKGYEWVGEWISKNAKKYSSC